MANKLKLRNFLINLDDDLLEQYFKLVSAQVDIPSPDSKEDREAVLEAQILGLKRELNEQIESDFISIQELATEGGILSLLELAQENGNNIASEIGKRENYFNQALYAYLNHQELFNKASILYYVTELTSKAERAGLKKREAEKILSKGEALSAALKAYLSETEGRGRQCKVEAYEFPDRVCFIAYPQDYAQSDLFYEGDTLKRVTRNPSFQIVFVYYPDLGRLEIAARYGKKRKADLFNIFNEHVLGDKNPVKENQVIHDLDKLLDPNFEFVLDPQDQITEVYVKRLRVASKFNYKKRFIIELDSGDGVKTIQDEAKYRNLLGNQRDHYVVTQATIQMKFPGEGKKGSVTFTVTTPDRTSGLNDTPNHIKAKKYLSKWGLENEAEINGNN